MISRAYKLVQAARTALLLEQPFFGVLSLRLQLIEDPSCKTAWTNGSSLGFSPAFVESLKSEELIALIAHEVMHCACGHPWRRDNREPKKWNYAADYAINALLHEAGFKLPEGGLLDQQYANRSSEWIYDRIPDPPSDDGGNGQPGQGSAYGDVRDAPTNGSDDSSTTEADWQQATKSAANAARGSLPGSLKRSIDQISTPRVDWRSLLRRYLQDVTRSDYTWTKPSRRYMVSGLYLPSLHSEDMGRMTIAVDTSGSIDDVLLSQFGAEINAIASEMKPSSIEVIYCDARINRIDQFERGDIVTLEACGGGGTSFIPVFDHVDHSDDPPAVVVYLTDMEGSFPSIAPSYPVIWANYGRADHPAPFGDVVPCE